MAIEDFKRLTEDPVYAMIVKARVKLLFEVPFFGMLTSRMEPIDASSWLDTAATDGRYFYYNREFIKKLQPKELLFLMAHEVMHCVYDHLGRRQHRDPKLWNMANDYIANFTLMSMKIGTPLDGTLYDPQYDDTWSSEALYEHFKKNSITIKDTIDVHLELGSDSKRKGKGGQGNPDKEGSGGEPGEGEGGGPKSYSYQATIVGKNGPPTVTEADMEQIRAEFRAAVIQTVQSLGAGKVPAGVMRMVEDLIEPKMDWRAMLNATIQSCIKDDYQFNRPSRKSWAIGTILPGQNFLDTIDIAVAIDFSGSMTPEMLRDFLSEVKGIMETFRDFRLRLWTFDTKVYNYKLFTGENLDEIYEYQGKGGGGTIFECNWEFMKREGIEPERFVLFTDGFPGNTWGESNYCDTLFIIYGNDQGKRIKGPDWGVTAYYEPLAA